MSEQYWKRAVGAIATAFSIISFNALSAQASEPATFTLVNSTNRPLLEFYASPPSSNNWEEDILGRGVLEPGESTEITINDGRSDCLYDLKGVLGAGDGVGRGELIESQVHICDGETYEYSGKN
ncbi:MAG: hypothetical protein H7126_16565 [Candidatus Parcubacteria bacterium]|nr:hypothetical protein [Leptolyngbyaceae cyanobacterium LF-bin-113]